MFVYSCIVVTHCTWNQQLVVVGVVDGDSVKCLDEHLCGIVSQHLNKIAIGMKFGTFDS
ncbi:hypothetical protein SAMD00019534_107880 [Acytostelium subglobosum LB1]|uniref:hypothetical protein n=1 Tax=Acytostelium subglobosum LB1 TaxID=1410327 RepID=UPI0006448040|nr:hypothetical protein SAMD00019534_107880 [Acytostelium subglobosum LB1]GAM27612.1 hypothetical protein SAMD00019534_107880 [Acytostelium subglobosum LB1]|eukprot:XP_012749271.1 hypothetical protein SAMD00019534_107880 [Acytostelium subglobosum LB1]